MHSLLKYLIAVGYGNLENYSIIVMSTNVYYNKIVILIIVDFKFKPKIF